MARKGRNIYKRKDGRWEGRIILGYDMDGKRRYHSVYGRNFGETKQKMQEYTEKYGEVRGKGKTLEYIICFGWSAGEKTGNRQPMQIIGGSRKGICFLIGAGSIQKH